VIDQASRLGSRPIIMLAAGRAEDDAAAIWTVLLEVAPAILEADHADDRGSVRARSSADRIGGGPVAWP